MLLPIINTWECNHHFKIIRKRRSFKRKDSPLCQIVNTVTRMNILSIQCFHHLKHLGCIHGNSVSCFGIFYHILNIWIVSLATVLQQLLPCNSPLIWHYFCRAWFTVHQIVTQPILINYQTVSNRSFNNCAKPGEGQNRLGRINVFEWDW